MLLDSPQALHLKPTDVFLICQRRWEQQCCHLISVVVHKECYRDVNSLQKACSVWSPGNQEIFCETEQPLVGKCHQCVHKIRKCPHFKLHSSLPVRILGHQPREMGQRRSSYKVSGVSLEIAFRCCSFGQISS